MYLSDCTFSVVINTIYHLLSKIYHRTRVRWPVHEVHERTAWEHLWSHGCPTLPNLNHTVHLKINKTIWNIHKKYTVDHHVDDPNVDSMQLCRIYTYNIQTILLGSSKQTETPCDMILSASCWNSYSYYWPHIHTYSLPAITRRQVWIMPTNLLNEFCEAKIFSIKL